MTKSKINKFGIKISEKEQIEAALAEVNGKASKWVLDTHKEIVDRCMIAEGKIENLPMSQRVGATATATGYAPQVKAYRNSVVSTKVFLRRFSEGWRVMDIQKIYLSCKDSRASKVTVMVTADQLAKIKEVAVRGLEVQKAA